MAKKANITFEKNATEKHLKPYCEQAAIAAVEKGKADALRPLAAEELQSKLDGNPQTKGYTGTVVYLCDDKIHKIRVQRPDKTNWRKKRLKDPNLKAYKALMDEIDEKQSQADQLKEQLSSDHPKCLDLDFTIAYLK